MQLVYSFNIKQRKDICDLCRASTNLYNQALYIIRTTLDKEGRWLSYADTNRLMPHTLNLDGECNYRLLKAQVAQQTLRVLDKNIKAYIKSIKDWKKHSEKYKSMPQMPHYRKRGGMNTLIYPNQSCSIRDGRINLSKEISIAIPQWKKYKDAIKNFYQVRIKPLLHSLKVEIVYNAEQKKNKLDMTKYASIDLGIDNLATLVTEEGAYLFGGKYIKAYNQFFNKKLHRLQSIKDKQNIKTSTKRIRQMYERRDNFISDVFHKASHAIVRYLVEHEIGNLVVGYNAGWKQRADMGKRTNQRFMQIPFARLGSYLAYKCAMAGIRYVENEESYTSKCDALALEPIGKHDVYKGKRIKRGLFRSSVGTLINADMNGAINIMRKVVGDSDVVQRIVNSGRSLRPIRLSSSKDYVNLCKK